METDTTNYLNLSICLGGLLIAHFFLIWKSTKHIPEDTQPKAKKKKSK